MRRSLTLVSAGRIGRLAAILGEVEGLAGELSAAELLEGIGRCARLDATLRARLGALEAPAANPEAPDGPRYLDAGAAAAYLSVSKSTVVRLVKVGKLTPRHVSKGAPRFDRADLDAYMAGSEVR